MIDIPAATVARALDVLRKGAMRADAFARAMWPERCASRSPGRQAQSGHALLRQLALVGYARKVGDLWTLRAIGSAERVDESAISTADGSALGQRMELPDGLQVRASDEAADPQARQLRLEQLVRLADEPVPGVTSDRALGDVAIRGRLVDDGGTCEGLCIIADALAFIVLAGVTMNVYPPIGPMLYAVRPIEAARALHVRWARSGQPPSVPHDGWWFRLHDGIAAVLDPAEEDTWGDPEFEPQIEVRLRRQREAAGLA
jgi:hypothetical protein